MPIASIIKLLLTLASSITQYAHDKKLIDAGAAQAILKGINDAEDTIKRANNARANANSVPVESDPDDRANR